MKQFLLVGLFALPSFLLAQPTLTFNLTDGETDVPVDQVIIINSDENLETTNGDPLSASNVVALISFTDDSSNPVDFNVTVDGPRKKITITPVSDLSENTTYTLTLQPVQNNSDEETTLESITFTTGDFTDPSFTVSKAIDNTGDSFTFRVNVDEDATVYYIVDRSTSPPSHLQIRTGKDAGGNAAEASGSFSVTKDTDHDVSISGLDFSPPVKFNIYFFAEDDATPVNTGNVTSRGLPFLNSSSIPPASVGPFDFDLRVNVDEPVTTYYVVTQSSTPPSATQIINGQNESGGTPDKSGNFDVSTADTDTDENISGLNDLTTYYVHFVSVDGAGNQTVVATESATTTDGTPPAVTLRSPVDGSATVDVSTNSVTLTFDEDVTTINTAPSGNSGRVRLYENGSVVETIDRNDFTVGSTGAIDADGSSATATITFVHALKAKTNYYILVGDDVFEDAAGNDFDGYLSSTDWNFTTSGVTINNASSSICSGSFQAISNIVISENGAADFNNGSNQKLILSLANTSDFVISNSGVSVTGTSADITALSFEIGLTSITITYTVSGGTVVDNITISGLKIYATGGTSSTTIRRSGGDADQDGNNGTGASSLTYAMINVGATAPDSPELAASQDVVHCDGEDISMSTLSLADQGTVTYNWYSDASLSTLVVSTPDSTVNLVSDLNMTTPAVPGTYKFYVVTVGACQSAPPTEIDVQVGVNPTANAGTDKTADPDEVCTGTAITLGGNPTLKTPSAAGNYTYSWDYLEGSPEPAAEANPVFTVSNSSRKDSLTYHFEVTITDANGCVGKDTVAIEVKPTFNVSLLSPNSYVFSPNSPNQTLVGSPADGIFSGVGVVQSNANTYQFSPTIAHATDPNTLPKSFSVFYTVTQDGCTQTNVPVATFTISNSFFSNLQSQYCSAEFPDPNIDGVTLSLDNTGYTFVNNRMTSWNTSERFTRGPYNTPWVSGGTYPYDSYVRYNNEIYRCVNTVLNIPLACSGSGTPDAGGQWAYENILKVKFDGYIANLYEGYYGGNQSGPTIVKLPGTYTISGDVSGKSYNYYRMGTNVRYNYCDYCNYVNPAAYVEFERPEDIRLILPAWSPSFYYYRGDIVSYNNQVYQCIAPSYTVSTQPNLFPADWTVVTNSDYSNGQYFHKYDASISAYRSGFYVNGQFVQINKNPTVFFNGLVNDQDVCEFDVLKLDDVANSTGIVYDLTGNFSNQNLGQEFQVRLDGSAVFDMGGGAIENDIIKPGLAKFDSKEAFLNSPAGAASVKNIDIQYKVDPGTKGSTGTACFGTSTITVQVVKNSNFDFDASVDPDGSVYCYTEPAKGLRSAVGGTVISGAAGAANSVVYSGFGVNDLGNSQATFTPSVAINQIAPGTTTQQIVPVTVLYRDANQCRSTRVRNFKVNPDLQPSFTFGGRVNYCYEDITNGFVGHFDDFSYNSTTVTSTGKYQFYYKDPGSTQHVLQTVNGTNASFTPQPFYDQIQGILNTGGFTADLNQTTNVNVVYTETLNADQVCSETYSQTMAINPPAVLDIFGLTDGDVLCRNNNSNVSQGNLVTFDGSISGSGIFKLDDDSDFSAINPTLNGTVNTTAGKATINLLSAYNAASDGTDPRQVFLQYQYTAPGCTGPAEVIKGFEISPPPDLTFDFSASPGDGEVFCYDETPVQLSTLENTNVTVTGYGVTDSGAGNGTATFNPELAYNTSVSNGGTLNTPQNIVVTARIVDGLGCANTNSITYDVNPIPTASLVTGSLDYCYEDAPRLLQGQQAKSWFSIVYQGVTTPHTDNSLGDITNPMSEISFDPAARFDDAVNNFGASALTPVNFNVFYTVADNNNCTNTIGPYTLAVANQIDVSIAGLDDNDIYCSNETGGVKMLSFNPFPSDASKRSFTINGQTQSLSSDKYSFNPGLAGGDFTLQYVVISGNNCTNTKTKTVKVLPSPQAIFQVEPECEGDLIDFNADGTNNLSSALYTWTLSDSTRTGQNLQHRFPGVSTYSVALQVAYPAYNGDPALVCRDSLRLDQIVGPVPAMDFSFFNVCESDQTSFEAQPDIPISTVSWDFNDGVTTGFGFLADNIPASADRTLGTYGAPNHQYAAAGSYLISVTGKTADIFGGCENTISREVAILKNWAPTPAQPLYDMSQLDGGKGFWVKEDVNGNSSWEFNVPSKKQILTPERAWVTGATEPYKPDDVSYVNSPCFDLSSFSRPVLSLKHWTDTDFSDGAVVQYSVDGGETWRRLGDVASGLQWYNRPSIASNPGEQTGLTSGWSLVNQNAWVTGKHTLDVVDPSKRNQVRFRIAFSSFANPDGKDGFAFNNVIIEERNRTILAENFTNLSATANNAAFQRFKADSTGFFNTDEIVKLQYHHSSGTVSDQLNQANPSDQDARAAFYGVTSATRAFIDGGFGETSTNATFASGVAAGAPLDRYFNLRSLVTSPVNISIDFVPEPSDKLNVKATVQATSDLGAAGQYNIFIAVAEQAVLNQVYVLRKFLPDASGTPLTSLSASAPAQEVIASYDMRHVTRLPNGQYAPFAVIVFVQNLETKEVLQTAIRQDGNAATSVVTGIETPAETGIRLYPNPADHALNVILSAPVKNETPLKVYDMFGRHVYGGTFGAGEDRKVIETKSLPTGVYLIELLTPEGRTRKKVMVTHE